MTPYRARNTISDRYRSLHRLGEEEHEIVISIVIAIVTGYGLLICCGAGESSAASPSAAS